MTMRAVLIDDELPARARLRRMLEEVSDVAIVGEAGDVATAVTLLDTERPDLCFLDVRMPGGDGFEVLERASHRPRVIFTTAYDEYAVRAFEVHSVDYLLKPFSRARLGAALERLRAVGPPPARGDEDAMRTLLEAIRASLAGSPDAHGRAVEPESGRRPMRIPARRGAKIILLDPAEVSWFEADDTLVHARVGESRYLVERPLGELEQVLATTFFRAHRSYLVNLARVAEIVPGEAGTYRIVMRDEARNQVPLSRRQAQKLREIIPW